MNSNDPDSLESRLRQSPPRAVPPADLHNSILSAVRSAGPGGPRSHWKMRVVALAAVASAVGAFWWMARPRSPEVPGTAAITLVEEAQQSAHEASGMALNPLTQEMEALARDLTNATRFVRASVPLNQTL